MQIEILDRLNGSESNLEDLNFYLSQIVLSRIDEGIKKTTSELNEKKIQLKNVRNTIGPLKVKLDQLTSIYSRELQLDRVLTMIDVLIKENVLIGSNRIHIINLLNKLNELTYQKLQKLEEKLSIYLPNKYLK